MITTALLIAMATQPQAPKPRPTWMAVTLDRQHSHNEATIPASSGLKLPDPSPHVEASGPVTREHVVAYLTPEAQERVQAGTNLRARCNTLLDANKAREAYSLVCNFLKARPDCANQVADSLVVTALLSVHYREAYRESLRMIQDNISCDDVRYLWFSLAASACGEGYDGQAEYCADMAHQYAFKGRLGGWHDAFVRTNDPKKLMLMSSVALGQRWVSGNIGFNELALKLDPSNELAARTAISYYRGESRFSDVRRVASQMLRTLPKGESRTWFTKELENATDKPDKPYEIIRSTTNKP